MIQAEEVNGKMYFILELIGKGSFGQVYKAKDQQDNIVAIKIQNGINQNELKLVNKFLGRKFKNLVNILDFQVKINKVVIIMELGELSLQDKIQQNKLQQKDARYLMKQIANGIFELHSLQVAHRDLKPENILIFKIKDQYQYQEIYKICDFGTSKDYSNIKTPCIGTPYYLAPEQLYQPFQNYSQKYNEKIDIWAFGALTWELFTGVPLFNGFTIQEIYIKIQNLNIEDEIKKLSNLESTYKDLLIEMLQRDPNKRINTIDLQKKLSTIEDKNRQILQKVPQPSMPMNQGFQRGRQCNQDIQKIQPQLNVQPKLVQVNQQNQNNYFVNQKQELHKVAQAGNAQQQFQISTQIQNKFNVADRGRTPNQIQKPRFIYLSPQYRQN